MPYKKDKQESYVNVGGINEKNSTYIVGEKNVLNIENMDFQEPGALTARMGTTLAVSVSPAMRINSIFQNNGISGTSLVLTTFYSGDRNIYINTTFGGQNFDYGASLFIEGASGLSSYFFGPITHDFQNNYVNFGKITIYNLGPYLFKYDASQEGSFFTFASQFYFFGQNAPSMPGPGFGSTGTGTFPNVTLTYKWGFADLYSYATDDVGQQNYFIGNPSASTQIVPQASVNGKFAITLGALVPADSSRTIFNPRVSYIARNNVSGFDPTDFVIVGTSFAGATFIFTDLNATVTPNGVIGRIIPASPNIIPTDPFGRIYLEEFNGSLFVMLGSSNITYYSEIGDPQRLSLDNQITLIHDNRVNSGMKKYQQALIMSLQKGIFRITGDANNGFDILQITTEYGFVSHKAVVIWHERMWFLDEKGIIEYNGANLNLISNPIEDTIKRINFSAAIDKAYAMHLPNKNQIWFSVPVDGSTDNNLILVYDYYTSSWAKFTGLNPSSIVQMYIDASNLPSLSGYKYAYGNSLGKVHFFDDNALTDSGVGITTVIQTRFHAKMGESQTEQFRRLFADFNAAPPGATIPVTINMYTNHASLASASLSKTIYRGATMQNRIDFGVPAKSMSVEFVQSSTTDKCKFYGYTLESRFQRSV